MARIPMITERDGLSAEQQQVFDAVKASRGGVRGPFSVLLHSPAVCAAAEMMGGYLRFGTQFPDAVREAAILATAAHHNVDYEFGAHSALALKNGWLDQATVDAIESGRTSGLAGDVAVAVNYVNEIHTAHRVSDETFRQVSGRWGERGALDLAAIAGYYAFLAAVLNTFEVHP